MDAVSLILAEGGKPVLGHSEEAVDLMLKDRSQFDAVVPLVTHEDHGIQLKVCSALEKVGRKHREYLVPHYDFLLEALPHVKGSPWLRTATPLLLSYLPLQGDDVGNVADTLIEWIGTEENKWNIVTSIQGLANIAYDHEWLRGEVRMIIEEWNVKGSAAIKARCRKILARLEKLEKGKG